jgi:hypothetical protein
MPRRLAHFVSLVSLVLAPLSTAIGEARAQATTTSDSVRAAIPSREAARAGASSQAATDGRDTTRPERNRLPVLFYGTLAGAATAAAVLHVDPDSGGYRDGWATATDFPDKAVHALAAWALTTIGVDLGARPRNAAIAVCAAGAAFEFAQGYASPYDIAADCIGASGAALWQSWRAHRRERAAIAKAAAAKAAADRSANRATSTVSTSAGKAGATAP